jgi:hypothetical protein
MNNLIFYSNCRFPFHIICGGEFENERREKGKGKLSITFIYLSVDEALLPWKRRKKNEESELKV